MRISDWSSDVCSSDLIADHIDGGDVARLEQQLPAHAPTVVVVELAPVGGVGDDPVRLRPESRQAERRASLIEHHRSRRLQPDIVERAIARRRLQARIIEVRLSGDDVERAGRAVLAEQRSLRAAQHLDPLDIVEVEERSEEHTSELQSLMRISYAVFCLKKTNTINTHN